MPHWTSEAQTRPGAARPLLEVRDLKTYFPIQSQAAFRGSPANVRAVDGVSFSLYPGETLGLVGESGSGKSTVARSILLLEKPTSGDVYFDGRSLSSMSPNELHRVRRNIQMVFQDPYSSLDPRMSVARIISEPWRVHRGVVETSEERKRIYELLDQVGLRRDDADRYPNDFSGGQRQRIGIARALALNPKVLICDEPVSALDVSVQAQVINLLEDLQDEHGLAYLFISHDLSVVRHVANRLAVMYLGKIVEFGEVEDVYERSVHPYTQALLSAVPKTDLDEARSSKPILLSGEIPSPMNPPSGCSFRTRCWKADDLCSMEEPALRIRLGKHESACHYADYFSPIPSSG